MNIKLYSLIVLFILFLSIVNAASYTSTLDVYKGFTWDDYKNYSVSWNEYLGNLFYTGGNVGIGTTSPQQKLHVNGSLLVNDTIFTQGTKNLTLGYDYALNASAAGSSLWNANYSDYLTTKNYALNDSRWSLNYSDYLTTKNYALNDSRWSLNYSTFLTHITWANAVNGTLATAASVLAANTSLAYYANTTVNNSMKAYVDSVSGGAANWNANYSDYLVTKNYALNDSRWSLNYSNFSAVYGYALNASAAGSALWNANYSAFLSKINWSQAVNGTLMSQATFDVNYSAILGIDAATNTSLANYVEAYYLRNDGDNGTGVYNFDGGWATGGVTIDGGSLYAQTVYVYNISSLQVNNIEMNGSLYPDVDDTFSLGNGTYRWKSGNFSGNVSASWLLGNINASNIQNAPWVTGATETDPKWGANYSDYLTTKNYALNDSKWSLNYSNFSAVYGYALNASSSGSSLWNANYSAFGPYLNWTRAYNGTLAKTDASNVFGDFNQTFDTNTLFIDAVTGRVGIGTTSPSQKLTISGGNVSLDAGNAFDWGNGNSRIIGDSNWNLIFSTYTGASLTEKMRIGSTGNLTVDTSTLFVDAVSDRVGIGTTAPGAKLDVVGNIRLGNTAYQLQFEHGTIYSTSSSPNRGIRYDAPGTTGGWYGVHDFYTGYNGAASALAMRIINGNVGIGTTAPGAKLHAYSTSANTNGNGIFYVEQDVATNYPTMVVEQTTSGGNSNMDVGLVIKALGASDLTSNTLNVYGRSGSSALVVKNSGNVGIGNTTPAYKLHVAGGANVEQGVISQGYNLTTGYLYALNNTGGGLWNANYSDYLVTKNYALNDSLWSLNYSNFSAVYGYALNASAAGSALWNANYSDYLVTKNYALNDSKWSLNYSDYLTTKNYALNDSRWSLNYSDYLTTKNYALNDSRWSLNYSNFSAVYGYALNASASGSTSWNYNYSAAILTLPNSLSVAKNLSVDTNILFVDSASNMVGVGTAGPGRKFHVAGSESPTDSIMIASGFLEVDGYNPYSNSSGGGENFRIGWPTATRVGFTVEGNEAMTLLPSGKVGINKTAPEVTLDVNGETKFKGDMKINGNINVTENITIGCAAIYVDSGGDIVFRSCP